VCRSIHPPLRLVPVASLSSSCVCVRVCLSRLPALPRRLVRPASRLSLSSPVVVSYICRSLSLQECSRRQIAGLTQLVECETLNLKAEGSSGRECELAVLCSKSSRALTARFLHAIRRCNDAQTSCTAAMSLQRSPPLQLEAPPAESANRGRCSRRSSPRRTHWRVLDDSSAYPPHRCQLSRRLITRAGCPLRTAGWSQLLSGEGALAAGTSEEGNRGSATHAREQDYRPDWLSATGLNEDDGSSKRTAASSQHEMRCAVKRIPSQPPEEPPAGMRLSKPGDQLIVN
jgi:hypothetical protein